MAILLCSLALGKTLVWSVVPPVIYPLAALYLFRSKMYNVGTIHPDSRSTTPLVQIIAVCYLPQLLSLRSVTLQKAAMIVSQVGLAALIAYVSMHWAGLAPHFSQAGQILAVVAVALATHFVLYRRLQRHFATADLTY